MYSQQAKKYLIQLMNGQMTMAELEALNNDDSREAISFSAKLFGDITQETRGIYTAMKSTFVTRIKRSPKVFRLMKKEGISAAATVALMGKNVEVTIKWEWMDMATRPYLTIVTPLPNGWNGYAFPLDCILQDFDAKQCQRIFSWVKSRQ